MKVSVVESKQDVIVDLLDMPKNALGIVISCFFPEYIGKVVLHLGGNKDIPQHVMVPFDTTNMVYNLSRGHATIRLLPPNSVVSITT